MKKRIIGLLLVVILIIAAFAGCGASTTSEVAPTYRDGMQNAVAGKPVAGGSNGSSANSEIAVAGDSTAFKSGSAQSSEAQAASAQADSIGGGVNLTQDVNNAILSERKIIRSANVTLEVENFDEAYGKIDTFILGIGFIQETNINTDRIYVDNKQKLIKKGTIVLRVDKQKFEKVLNNLKGIGTVFNWTINGEDVTDKYFDVESRLRLLKFEETRLEEYLKKLTDIDQIFKTESRLTDIRQEIESLTGNLKKMDDLVELSTITINMNEKYPDSVAVVKPKTYGQRLLTDLIDSMKGVVDFCGELVIIIVTALPVLVMLALFVILVLYIYRRISGKNRRKPAAVRDTALDSRESRENIGSDK